MRIYSLTIQGFRGLLNCQLTLSRSSAIVGPNGCGKSTVIDALSLLFGRQRLVRPLTEHDFTGSSPSPESRIKIIATVGDFPGNNPSQNDDWFRSDRAVPKWLDEGSGQIHATGEAGRKLCTQIAFAARFDHEELAVETLRYFHDDDTIADPFLDEGQVVSIPNKLLADFGYFVLPARRTWEGSASFNSELFKRVVADAAGIPASEILQQRDHLRSPPSPVEESAALSGLVTNMNRQLSRLLPTKPTFKLRLTSADSEAVLQALLPHYTVADSTLPVSRHGAGLLSLQTLLLLLEVGRARKNKGMNFILALEEPELHLAPGLQARLVVEAERLSDQTITTTHAPKVASLHDPTEIYVMTSQNGTAKAPPLLAKALAPTASNQERKLYGKNRSAIVEAVMHPNVLVPEGRFDAEWFSRLVSVGEDKQTAPPFSSIFGVAPTEDSAVVFTVERLRALRPNVFAVVDGDSAGDRYVEDLCKSAQKPDAIIQLPEKLVMEDLVGWLVAAGGDACLNSIKRELGGSWIINDLSDLVSLLRTANNQKTETIGLKEDLIAHDCIVAAMRENETSAKRAAELLDAFVAVVSNEPNPMVTIVTQDSAAGTPPLYKIKFP